MKIIVDTDCGTDDLLALAFLLAHPKIEIEGITTVHGLASAHRGAINLLRVLTRLGLEHIPVYVGSEAPIGEARRFPAAWIEQTERLPNVKLPETKASISSVSAHDYLCNKLSDLSTVSIVALGPLTNIAKVLNVIGPHSFDTNPSLIAMGGAIDVEGNLNAGGEFATENVYAEWNFFIDPTAVDVVLSSHLNFQLVPLDATSLVPIRPNLVRALQNGPRTELSSLVLEILEGVSNWIEEGHYFAWDPLAAVIAASPGFSNPERLRLGIQKVGPNSGRLIRDATAREIEVFNSADAERFENEYVSTLQEFFG